MPIRNRFVGGLAVAAAAGLLVAAIGPAAAAPQPGRSAAPTEAGAPAAPTKAKAKERKYCMRYELTGSRLTREDCKTKAEWEDAGVDTRDFDN